MPQISDDIPLSALRILLAIGETGSLTEAARRNGVSQPAASKAIARLEEQTGLPLIRRDHRPVTLTREGQVLADHGRQQLQMSQALHKRLADCRVKGSGLVRVASFGPSASTHILPGLIAAAHRTRPLLEVEISEMSDQLSLQAVRDGSADFAIALEQDLPDMDLIPLTRDRLVALISVEDPFAKRRSADVSMLNARDFILTKGGSEPLVREWFSKCGYEPTIRHNIQQITSILAMVRAGMGMSIIAEMAVPSNHDGIAVLPLAPEMPRVIGLVRKTGSFASHAAELFWSIAKQHAASDLV